MKKLVAGLAVLVSGAVVFFITRDYPRTARYCYDRTIQESFGADNWNSNILLPLMYTKTIKDLCKQAENDYKKALEMLSGD